MVYVESSTEVDISLLISNLRGKIDYYKKRAFELKNKLINKSAECAEEYIRIEALSRGRQN